jgi:hypothetical protein
MLGVIFTTKEGPRRRTEDRLDSPKSHNGQIPETKSISKSRLPIAIYTTRQNISTKEQEEMNEFLEGISKNSGRNSRIAS